MNKEDYIIKIMKENQDILLWQEKHLIKRFNSNTSEIRKCITKAREYKNEDIIFAETLNDMKENPELFEIYKNELAP